MLLYNADLISFTSAAVPNGRGGVTPGSSATTAYTPSPRCRVQPYRKSTTLRTDELSDATSKMYVEMPLTPEPVVGGRLTHQLDGAAGPVSLEIVRKDDRVHGSQSHYELLLRAI